MTAARTLTLEPRRRWWSWLRSRRITCAAGHHIPATFHIPESGLIRCSHWLGTERRECGRWIFLVSIRGGGNIVVDVTVEERKELEKLTTPAEMLDYLELERALVARP